MAPYYWRFVFASTAGSSHTIYNIPCQDAAGVEEQEDFTISVVCDGAGSAENSQLGSAFVVANCLEQFKFLITKSSWHLMDSLPNEDEWKKLSKEALFSVRKSLENYSLEKEVDFKSLACTVIVAITLRHGLLTVHIGDGRAGYWNSQGDWLAAMIPFHGEEANETVFITSDIWHNETIDLYVECRVIGEDVKAICLLSDGCENAAFECNLYNAEKEVYYDPNKPYEPFFRANVKAIPTLFEQGLSQNDINDKWRHFLDCGNEKLKIEPDDKTMILGVKIVTSQ